MKLVPISLVPFGVVKTSALAAAIVAGVATAIVDPSVKIAVITGISMVTAAFVAALASMVTAILSYKLQKQIHNVAVATKDAVGEVKRQTDGMYTKMTQKMDNLADAKEQQTIKLVDTSVELARAQGVQQERVEERTRQEDVK